MPNVSDEMVEAFIEEGFLSYDDLTFMEPAELAELGGVAEEEAEEIIVFAEEAAERIDQGKDETAEEADEEETAGRKVAGLLAEPGIETLEGGEGDVAASETPSEASTSADEAATTEEAPADGAEVAADDDEAAMTEEAPARRRGRGGRGAVW